MPSEVYLVHIADAPHGRTIPDCVTGRPISLLKRLPPNFFGTSEPSIYSITDGESPVV